MTPEQQRIAIAKACQWKQPNHRKGFVWMPIPDGMVEVDPLSDLNAVHEVLMTLDDWEEGAAFDNHLFKILIRKYGSERVSTFAKLRAEASEFAEAFLKTRNLWTE